MKRRVYVHAPVMTLQEASLLPAMPKDNLAPPEKAMPAPRRRGSAAGRAILHEPGVSMPGVGPMSSK